MANPQSSSSISSDRGQQLRAAAQANVDRQRPPLEGVRVASREELFWLYQLWGWSGDEQLPPTKQRPDLRGADFSNANLNAMLFNGAVLSGAQFQSAFLIEARFNQAILDHASLEGADLTKAQLERANLSHVRASGAILSEARLNHAHAHGADLNHSNLSKAVMIGIDAHDAILSYAVLIEADLTRANLEGAALDHVSLNGATLNSARLNAETDLTETSVGYDEKKSERHISLGDVEWNGVALTRLEELPETFVLGDEKKIAEAKTANERSSAIAAAARAYRGLALALRAQGLIEPASAARFREQQLMRRLAFVRGQVFQGIGLSLLEFVSGYGERIGRTLLLYVVVILGFTGVHLIGQPLSSDTFLDAFVFSFTSFHGRGYFPGLSSPLTHNPQVIAALVEGLIGFFIELNLIATFTRRFLGG